MTASRSSPAPRMTVLPLPLPQVPVPAALGGRSRDATAAARRRRPRRRQLARALARRRRAASTPGESTDRCRRAGAREHAAGRPGPAGHGRRSKLGWICRGAWAAASNPLVCSREIFFPREDKFLGGLSFVRHEAFDSGPGRRIRCRPTRCTRDRGRGGLWLDVSEMQNCFRLFSKVRSWVELFILYGIGDG